MVLEIWMFNLPSIWLHEVNKKAYFCQRHFRRYSVNFKNWSTKSDLPLNLSIKRTWQWSSILNSIKAFTSHHRWHSVFENATRKSNMFWWSYLFLLNFESEKRSYLNCVQEIDYGTWFTSVLNGFFYWFMRYSQELVALAKLQSRLLPLLVLVPLFETSHVIVFLFLTVLVRCHNLLFGLKLMEGIIQWLFTKCQN